VHELPDVVHVNSPGDETAVYPAIGKPSEGDAVHAIVAVVPVIIMVTPVGAATAGVTVFELVDAGLLPAALVAMTVKV